METSEGAGDPRYIVHRIRGAPVQRKWIQSQNHDPFVLRSGQNEAGDVRRHLFKSHAWRLPRDELLLKKADRLYLGIQGSYTDRSTSKPMEYFADRGCVAASADQIRIGAQGKTSKEIQEWCLQPQTARSRGLALEREFHDSDSLSRNGQPRAQNCQPRDLIAELHAVRAENSLLKQQLADLTPERQSERVLTAKSNVRVQEQSRQELASSPVGDCAEGDTALPTDLHPQLANDAGLAVDKDEKTRSNKSSKQRMELSFPSSNILSQPISPNHASQSPETDETLDAKEGGGGVAHNKEGANMATARESVQQLRKQQKERIDKTEDQDMKLTREEKRLQMQLRKQQRAARRAEAKDSADKTKTTEVQAHSQLHAQEQVEDPIRSRSRALAGGGEAGGSGVAGVQGARASEGVPGRISEKTSSNVLRDYLQGDGRVDLPEPRGSQLLAPSFALFEKVQQGTQTDMLELDSASLEEAGWREQRLSEMLSHINLVVSKVRTSEYLLDRRRAEVMHEEFPDIENARQRLGSVGKTAVTETGALIAMMQEAMGTMRELSTEAQELRDVKVRDSKLLTRMTRDQQLLQAKLTALEREVVSMKGENSQSVRHAKQAQAKYKALQAQVAQADEQRAEQAQRLSKELVEAKAHVEQVRAEARVQAEVQASLKLHSQVQIDELSWELRRGHDQLRAAQEANKALKSELRQWKSMSVVGLDRCAEDLASRRAASSQAPPLAAGVRARTGQSMQQVRLQDEGASGLTNLIPFGEHRADAKYS